MKTHRLVLVVSAVAIAAISLASCGERYPDPSIDTFAIYAPSGYTGDMPLTFAGDAGRETTVKVYIEGGAVDEPEAGGEDPSGMIRVIESESTDPVVLIEETTDEDGDFSIREDIIFMDPGTYELYGVILIEGEELTRDDFRRTVTVPDTKVDIEGIARVDASDATQDLAELLVGRSYGFELAFRPVYDEPTNDRVTWTVDDDSIATIDRDGRLSVINEGTVTITATSEEDPTISQSIQVTCVENIVDDTQILTVTTTSTSPQDVDVPSYSSTDVRFILEEVLDDDGNVVQDTFGVSFSYASTGVDGEVEYSVPGANVTRRPMPESPDTDDWQLDAGTYTMTVYSTGTTSDVTVPVVVRIIN